MSKNEDVKITMSIDGADESRVDIEKVRKAVEDFGEESTKVAQPVTTSLENIQRQWDKIADKITAGKAVTQRDVTVMVQQFTFLESAIEQGFGSLSNAPKEVQDAFRKVEAQIKSTTALVGKMDDAVKDNAGNMKAAAGQWSGLGNAIEAAGGRLGTAAGKFALFTAALKEGWSIGQQLNQTFHTDMSEWEKTVERFGMKANVVIKALSDNVMDMFVAIGAIASGDMAKIKQALDIWAKDSEASIKTVGEAVTKYGADWDKIHPSLEKAKKQHEEAAKAAEELAQQQKKAAEEAKKHAEEIQKLTDKLKDNQKTIEELKDSLSDAERGFAQSTSDLGYYGRALSDATRAVDEQRAAIAELKKSHADNDPQVQAASERLQELERSLSLANQRYDDAKESVERYESQQKSSIEQIKKAQDEKGKLALELLKEQTATHGATQAHVEAAKATTVVATASTAAAEATNKATTSIVGYRDETGRLVIKTVELGKESAVAAKNVDAVWVAAQNAAKELKSFSVGGAGDVSPTTKAFADMGKEIESTDAKAKNLLSTLHQIAEASGEATSGGGAAGVKGGI